MKSTALTDNVHSHKQILKRKFKTQTQKKFSKRIKLSISLQDGIPGPKQTRFIENQVTNSRMRMMCVYLGMTQMDFNFWTGNSWQ